MKFKHGLTWAVPRLGLALGLTFITLLAGVADLGCGGPQKKGEELNPVSLGDWCKEVNSKLCNSVAQSCFKGMSGFADGCLQSAMPSCLAGRDGHSPSGRTKGDLANCISGIQPLSCKELGKGLGSGKMAELCGATAPGGTTTPAVANPPASGTANPPATGPATAPAPAP